jgi:sodium-coupled monocarboxylate transporter 8/12
MTSALSLLDQIVIALYMGSILVVSGLIARKQRTGNDYFLAGRSMSGAKLAMSIVANQVSAVSLIGAPAFVALRGGMKWLQYELAVPLAMLLLIAFLLPALRAVSGASIYEAVERRFGGATRRLLASAFLLSRGLALGVILYASAVVISSAFGISIDSSIILVGLFSVAYTTMGGLAADIWTDVIQLVVLWTGVLFAVVFLLLYQDGALLSLIPTSQMKALAFDTVGLRGPDDFAFWPMLLGGVFLYLSYYGCDQSQAQRLLAARSERDARRSLVLNGILRFPLVLTYCVLGLLLAGLLRLDSAFAAIVSQGPVDALVPQFMLMYLPSGLRGIFIAAIFAAAMSSIDSAMNSLAAVTLEDVAGISPEKQGVWLSRAISLAWGMFAIGAGILFARTGSEVIVLINQIGSAFYGPVLAVFVLTVVTTRVKGKHAILGFTGGLLGNLMLAWLFPNVSWLWWNPFGFLVAVTVAIAVSRGSIELPVWSATRGETQLLIGVFLAILLTLAILF